MSSMMLRLPFGSLKHYIPSHGVCSSAKLNMPLCHGKSTQRIALSLKNTWPRQYYNFSPTNCGTNGQSCRWENFKSFSRQSHLWRTSKWKVPNNFMLMGAISFRHLSFALISPLAFLKTKVKESEKDSNYSQEIIANIPKEVFRTEIMRQKEKKRNLLMRILLAIWTQLRYTWRMFRVLLTFGPILALYPLTFVKEDFIVTWWKILLWACEFTGPTFIKLGQWASTRRDLFSSRFCDLFSRLHYCTKVHSWYASKSKLTKSFGKRWKEIFVKVEKRPVGSGCIAQVHRAWMRADMVPDESLVDEVLNEMDDTEDPTQEVDFAEGLEIIGLGAVLDAKDDIEDYIESKTSDVKKHVDMSQPISNSKSHPMPPEEETQSQDATVRSDASPKETSDFEVQPDTPPLPPPPPQPDGESLIPVAIKVLHPGIYKSVSRDLHILHSLTWLLESLVPSLKWLSLSECMEEFTDLMTRQIDLRFEAECLEQFVENFEDVPNIRFPRPVWPYCKRNVLVETYEEGEHISKYISGESDAPVALKELLAGYGVDALLQMVFVDNLVHGDLHPGNILVQNASLFTPQDENKLVLVDVCDTVVVDVKPVENPIRLVMLDAGITSSLNEPDLNNFRAVFTAVVIGEGEKVAELMLKHAKYNECADVSAFKSELGHLVMKYREQTIKLGKIRVGELLSEVFSVMSRHKVKMESSFASTLLAIFVLEGLGRSLDPELDILEKAKPILLGH